MLPNKKLVPLFTADARAHRLSIQKILENNSYLASMGGIFPIIQVQRKNKALQLCMAGTTYIGLKRYINHGSVVNTDFFVDIYADAKISDHFLMRLGTGHTSQHLSDDAIVNGGIFTNYARDYHQLFGIYKNNKYRLFVYGGGLFNYNFKVDTIDISNKFLFQFGFEHVPFKLGSNQYIFYAADFKWREELNYRSTQHYQFGYKYQKNGLRALRIAYNYSTGVEERGQFYKQNITFSSIGLYLDF
ncbi:MAG: DUF1207 domain-containing protein [Bacteroidia bacterium]|nr:DUF1207 domain-containing protein [Bacteroidia bacterium]